MPDLPRAIVRPELGQHEQYCNFVPAYLKNVCMQMRYPSTVRMRR